MIDINESYFSGAALAKVAGVDRKLLNRWLERGLIEPPRIERLAIRKRPMFSVVAIFQARLIKILYDSLAISASGSVLAGLKAERESRPGAAAASGLARLAKAVADEGWMWAVARSVDRNEPLALLAAINRRSNDTWRFFLEFDAGKFADRFGPEEPYAIVQVGAIFGSVYRDCISIYEGQKPKGPRSPQRAR